jgi:hypothetical protein
MEKLDNQGNSFRTGKAQGRKAQPSFEANSWAKPAGSFALPRVRFSQF